MSEKSPFTAEQEKAIDKFLEDNKDLIDSLSKLEDLEKNSFINKQVEWVKIAGKQNASMIETRGSGVLVRLKLEERMVIMGDKGLTTTEVKLIEFADEEKLMVQTKNSTYLVKKI